MKIYVMRHGDAVYRAPSDALRPLSERGVDEARLMGRWLADIEPGLIHLWHSPYLRAEQTTDTVCRNLLPAQQTALQRAVHTELIPMGDALAVRDKIAVFAIEHPGQPLLLISHMPLVSEIVAELVPGVEPPLFMTAAIAQINWQPEHFSGQLTRLQSPADVRAGDRPGSGQLLA